MAIWGGLGQAATVAQLVGADVGGLISMIVQAAVTARQNKKECEQLARRVFMIAELLPHLQDPEVMRRPLAGLGDTLREAHEIVASCQGRSTAYRFVMAWRQADKFRDVQSRIDSYLFIFPVISHIDITRRLDRIYGILLPNDSTTVPEIAEEVLLHGNEGDEFTFAELAAATNNFAPDTKIGEGAFGEVHMGRLPDGQEVAIKRRSTNSLQGEEEFMAEVTILSPIRHDHIVRLLGWCVQVVEKEDLLVYEYMKNGSLYDHLHGPSSSSSPVTASWKIRIGILLGVSRAIEYLQSSAERRPVIHRDIKPANILLDASWAPRLADFGLSLTFEPQADNCVAVLGTRGYADPEYVATGNLKPTSDVYSFGVVMLEVLTGRKAIFEGEMVRNAGESMVYFALPFVRSGRLRKVLDRRPAAKPTRRQLKAADLVAQTAARCLHSQGENRPAMSDVVAKLEAAFELVRFDG